MREEWEKPEWESQWEEAKTIAQKLFGNTVGKAGFVTQRIYELLQEGHKVTGYDSETKSFMLYYDTDLPHLEMETSSQYVNLDDRDVKALIDLALQTGDKEWFKELVAELV